VIWWVILIYAGGVVLVLSEFLVPGGICGTAGGLFILMSAGLGCYYYPGQALLIVPAEVVGLVASVVIGFNLLPKSSLGKALILADSQDADAGWVAAESDKALVGKQGEVLTALRPAGTIEVDRERIDAVSDAEFIDKGEKISVIEVHGSRVVVERVEIESQ